MGANHSSSGVMYKYLTTSIIFSEVSVNQNDDRELFYVWFLFLGVFVLLLLLSTIFIYPYRVSESQV